MTWEGVLSLVLAVILGAVIGAEREYHDKPAGLRTNILICLGAAVFTIISGKLGGGDLNAMTRIAAQIVTGVGFLGAGAIIRDRAGIHGLTTAATIWLVSSIGMACGAKYYLLAVVSTSLAIVVLFGLAPISDRLAKLRKEQHEKEARLGKK